MNFINPATSALVLLALTLVGSGLGPCRCVPDEAAPQSCCCGSHESGACPMAAKGGGCHGTDDEGEDQQRAPNDCGMPMSGLTIPAEPVALARSASAAPMPAIVALPVAVIAMALGPPDDASPPRRSIPPRCAALALSRSTVLRM